jgi:hypothetical protein
LQPLVAAFRKQDSGGYVFFNLNRHEQLLPLFTAITSITAHITPTPLFLHTDWRRQGSQHSTPGPTKRGISGTE